MVCESRGGSLRVATVKMEIVVPDGRGKSRNHRVARRESLDPSLASRTRIAHLPSLSVSLSPMPTPQYLSRSLTVPGEEPTSDQNFQSVVSGVVVRQSVTQSSRRLDDLRQPPRRADIRHCCRVVATLSIISHPGPAPRAPSRIGDHGPTNLASDHSRRDVDSTEDGWAEDIRPCAPGALCLLQLQRLSRDRRHGSAARDRHQAGPAADFSS